MTLTARRYGAQSMSSPLRDVLVKRPGRAFGKAFDDPAHGFLSPCDLALAQREHDTFVDVLASLGPTVHVLDHEPESDPERESECDTDRERADGSPRSSAPALERPQGYRRARGTGLR